jgi:nitrogen-specific signal transduction histidine kinase/CheY-like chemotaxis protein
MRLEEERLGLALRRSQKMDAIGQLTGGIAHDFNNLMAIILGNIELLKQLDINDDRLQKRLLAINKAAERAADLTRQLLGFSRTSAAEQTITDINQVIASMDNLIARSLTPEIRLEQRFADNLWLTKIDPGDFEDALLNLSLNARDAMRGHGHLIIETRNATLDDVIYCLQNPDLVSGDYVEIAISDDGEGMSLEQQEHIFEPFFTTKDEGTGLGLAMVFGFIKRSEGCINVYSEPGIGTTFKLYLPRAEDEIQQSMEKATEEITRLFHGHETVLVVDDEEGLLELARQLLEDQGYRVLTAANGKEALDQLANEPVVDLLFSDVVMPGGINGYELAEQATSQYAQLKVLLTSGYTEKAVAHNGQSRFDANLLSKPYNQSELLKRVRATLDNR